MSFIHAAFLAAGLAVAVPWLLHLTKKRKYLKIRLGSLQFLDPIVRDRHRMSQVEQWPLLALRCLAVLLLALAFARPFFPKPAPAPPVAGEFLVLLDASGSITPKQADALRKQAAKTIKSLPKATKAVLATVADRVEIINSLADYRPIPGAPSGMSRAVDWIVDRSASAPDAIAGVHWFTDLQKSQLPAAPSRLWPSGLSVEIHPLLPPTDVNVAIEQIDLLTPFGGDHWEIEARVRVFGMPGDQPLSISLTTADGKQVAATTPADGGAARFAWDGTAKDGLLTGEVAVLRSGDSWPADDRRSFVFPTTQPKRIHLVDGDPGSSPFLSETYFLEKALHASASGKALSPFRATISKTLPASGAAVDVIALCNVPGLTPENARELRGFVDRGVGLAVFLGDKTIPSGWTAATTTGIFPPGLRAFPEPAPAFIRRVDLTQPALSDLTREAARGLEAVALTRRFTWLTAADWVNAMEFDEATPLLAFSKTAKIAVFAHPVNREGSDLPLNPSFVPLMQGVFGSLARSPEQTAENQSVTASVPSLDDPRSPGIYLEAAATLMIAADVAEADISQVDEKSFRRLLGLPALDSPAPALAPLAGGVESSHQREGELWPWIVAALLALLTVESGLAARRIRPPAPADAHAN